MAKKLTKNSRRSREWFLGGNPVLSANLLITSIQASIFAKMCPTANV